jgi:8-oxo-dGTP diphosphatase
MRTSDQGTHAQGKQRHQVIPRTLIFLTSTNPQTGAQEVLLLKGAPTKRLWANLYNGLGGHIEANEDIYAAAQREVAEETGLTADGLTLRGVININTSGDESVPHPGVMVFVFCGDCPEHSLHATAEGTPEWIPVAELAAYPLVDDLYEVIPRALAGGPLFFAYYAPQSDGSLEHHFRR